MKLVIATHNRGKVAEISALLKNSSIELDRTLQLVSLVDYPDMPDIIEDGASFMENALKKARDTSAYCTRRPSRRRTHRCGS